MRSFKIHVRHSPMKSLSCYFVQREEVFKHRSLYFNFFFPLTRTFLRMGKYMKTRDFWGVKLCGLVNFDRGLGADQSVCFRMK
jgi:hypothetical protein